MSTKFNFNLTDNYNTRITDLNDTFKSLSKMNFSGEESGIQIGAKRINPSTYFFEEWNGSSWNHSNINFGNNLCIGECTGDEKLEVEGNILSVGDVISEKKVDGYGRFITKSIRTNATLGTFESYGLRDDSSSYQFGLLACRVDNNTVGNESSSYWFYTLKDGEYKNTYINGGNLGLNIDPGKVGFYNRVKERIGSYPSYLPSSGQGEVDDIVENTYNDSGAYTNKRLTTGTSFTEIVNERVGNYLSNFHIVKRTSSTTIRKELSIDHNGRVGIANASPGSYNSVANQLVIGNSTGDYGMTIVSKNDGYSRIFFANGTSGIESYMGFIIYDHPYDRFRIGTGGSDKVYITSNGNIGLNYLSPDDSRVYPNSKNLVLGGWSDTANGMTIASSNTGVSYIHFSDPDRQYNGQIYYNHADDSMAFRTFNGVGSMSYGCVIKSNGIVNMPCQSAAKASTSTFTITDTDFTGLNTVTYTNENYDINNDLDISTGKMDTTAGIYDCHGEIEIPNTPTAYRILLRIINSTTGDLCQRILYVPASAGTLRYGISSSIRSTADGQGIYFVLGKTLSTAIQVFVQFSCKKTQ